MGSALPTDRIDHTPSMPNAPSNHVTRLLADLDGGDRTAAERLFPLVYHELRALAGSFLAEQRPNHTLQPTALVHDAYLKMVNQPAGAFNNRGHFFAVAAKAMRQILTDHARKHAATKRGGAESHRVELHDDVAVTADRSIDLVALDEAMLRLAELDDRKARVVELRFFGGLTNEDVATLLGVSRATVADDWTVARAWLRSELARDDLN